MYIEREKRCEVTEMLGKTISEFVGFEVGSDSILFQCADGSEFTMWHDQDCCESVAINDIEGDIADLIGVPLVVCEMVDSTDYPSPPGEYVDSYTWTFYRLATQKGFVVIRWLGESNGYYSESVDFAKTKGATVS